MFKSKGIYIVVSIFIIFVFSFCIRYNLNAHQEGVSPGHSGSNYDGSSCATMACHNAPVYQRDGSLSSNIPSNGFIADSIYTITASLEVPNCTIFGFQASPQYDIGLTGGIIVTDPTRTLSLMGGLYITHIEGGSIGQDSILWSFDWKAPDTNIDVTIHSCFVAGNDFDSDSCYYDSIILHPFSNSINDYHMQENNIYPNPASDYLFIDYDKYNRLEIYNLEGSLIFCQYHYSQIIDISSLRSSYYILKVYTDKGYNSFKLLKL